MLAFIAMLLLGIVGALMIILILLQRGRGGGLAGAFGGAGGQSAFGTKAGDVFTKITVIFAVIWVALAGANILILRHNAAGQFGGGGKAVADEPAVSSKTDGTETDKDGTAKEGAGKDDATDGSLVLPDLPGESSPKTESSKSGSKSETKADEGADAPESSDAKTPADENPAAGTPESKTETENK